MFFNHIEIPFYIQHKILKATDLNLAWGQIRCFRPLQITLNVDSWRSRWWQCFTNTFRFCMRACEMWKYVSCSKSSSEFKLFEINFTKWSNVVLMCFCFTLIQTSYNNDVLRVTAVHACYNTQQIVRLGENILSSKIAWLYFCHNVA